MPHGLRPGTWPVVPGTKEARKAARGVRPFFASSACLDRRTEGGGTGGRVPRARACDTAREEWRNLERYAPVEGPVRRDAARAPQCGGLRARTGRPAYEEGDVLRSGRVRSSIVAAFAATARMRSRRQPPGAPCGRSSLQPCMTGRAAPSLATRGDVRRLDDPYLMQCVAAHWMQGSVSGTTIQVHAEWEGSTSGTLRRTRSDLVFPRIDIAIRCGRATCQPWTVDIS